MAEHRAWHRCLLVVAALAAVAAAGCGSSGTEGSDGTDRPSRRELRVFAASSLRLAFGQAEQEYEGAHPDVDVALTFGGSSSLARQIDEGAPADLVATADEASVAPLVTSGRLGPTVAFATNRLAVVVERGNPRGIDDLSDLAGSDTVTALCAPEVPCGRLAARWLDGAGVEVRPATLEASVDGVVSKVALGEADAGIAYTTDATAAAGVERAPVAQDRAAASDGALQARYVLAPVQPARSVRTGGDVESWSAFLRSGSGRGVLERAGFGVP